MCIRDRLRTAVPGPRPAVATGGSVIHPPEATGGRKPRGFLTTRAVPSEAHPWGCPGSGRRGAVRLIHVGPITVAVLNDCQLVVDGIAAMLAPYGDRVRVVELDCQLSVAAVVDVGLYDAFAVYLSLIHI